MLIFWNVENTLPILLKNSKLCSFIKTINLKQKEHVLRTFQFWPKSLYPDLTGVAIFLVHFLKCGKYLSNSSEKFKVLFFHEKSQFEGKTACFADFSILTKIAVSGPYRRGYFFGWFFEMLKRPYQFFWNIQNVVLSWRQTVWRKKSNFGDLSILTKIAVSGPYRRGHFFGWFFEMWKIPFQFFWKIQNFVLSSKQSVWSKNCMFCGLLNFEQNLCIRASAAWPFFWLIFWNVENTLPIVLKHSKCCCFMKRNSLKKKKQFLGTFQFWPKSLYPDLTGVAIFWDNFFGWFFEMLKIPFEFFGNIQNCVLLWKHSVWRKKKQFLGTFNFDQIRCIRTLPVWPFFWLIFWNVENTLPILLKHSKCCSFMKTNNLMKKKACLAVTFQFWPNSRYPDLTSVAIFLVDFFGWFFEMLKIPFQFFWNIQNVVLSWKQISLRGKNSNVLGTFQFWPTEFAVSGPYRRGHFFMVNFLKCWKYPSNSSETFKIVFFHQNNQFEAFFHENKQFEEKKASFGDLQFWPNSLYPVLTSVAIFLVDFFLVDFLKSWKYPSNSSETFKMCVLSWKQISLKQKQHVLRAFQFWPKSLYPDITSDGHFFGWLFEMSKIPFQLFWNIQNVALSWKQTVWRKKKGNFWGSLNFDQIPCIWTLPAMAIIFGWFFWLIFWNVENTLPILLKNSKLCSFIKTISLKKKQHVLRDFSILTKIAVSGPSPAMAIFFGWFFEMSKIPFQFFWNIQNVVLSWKQTVWRRKKKCFGELFNFDQVRCIRTSLAWPFFLVDFLKCWKYPSNSSETFKMLFFHENKQFEEKKSNVLGTFQFSPNSLYLDITSVAIFLVDFFGWFFELLKIPFQLFWKIQNCVLSSKQSVWSKNSMFYGLFNFDLNRCIWTLPAWPFFWLIFWNVESTIPIVPKHSKCCSFMKTNNF